MDKAPKKYTFEELDATFNAVTSLTFAYLDKAVKELNSMDLKNADKFTDVEKQKFNYLHTAISCALDITHRSFPLCYEAFPENKDNLDNVIAMFKRFEKAKLLIECPCDYCKELNEKEASASQDSLSSPEESNKVD